MSEDVRSIVQRAVFREYLTLQNLVGDLLEKDCYDHTIQDWYIIYSNYWMCWSMYRHLALQDLLHSDDLGREKIYHMKQKAKGLLNPRVRRPVCCANSWTGSPLRHQFHYRGKKWNHTSSPRCDQYAAEKSCHLFASKCLPFAGWVFTWIQRKAWRRGFCKMWTWATRQAVWYTGDKMASFECAKAGRPTWCCALNFRRWIDKNSKYLPAQLLGNVSIP